MKIKIRRGLKQDLPVLEAGEFGFCTDTKELFVGNASGLNNKVAQTEVSGEETEFIFDYKLGGNPGPAQPGFGTLKTEQQVVDFFSQNAEDFILAVLSGTIGIELTFPFNVDGQPYVRTFDDLFLNAGIQGAGWDSSSIDFRPISSNFPEQHNILTKGFSINLSSTKNSSTFETSNVPYEDIVLGFYFVKTSKNTANDFFSNVSIDENVDVSVGINNLNNSYNLINSSLVDFSWAFYLANSEWDYFYDYTLPVLIKITVPKFLKLDLEINEKANFIDSFLHTPLTAKEIDFNTSSNIPDNPGIGFYVPSKLNPGRYTNQDLIFMGNLASKQFLSTQQSSYGYTYSEPAYSFANDKDTGLTQVFGPNQLHLVAGGQGVLRASGSSASLSIVDGQSGTIIDNITQTKFLNAETSSINPIPNRANQLFAGSTIYRNDTTSARTYGIAPYYKTLASAGMTKSSTDHTWNLGYRRSIEIEFVRLNTGTMTITATADLTDGTNTYRTRFAIPGQASLATSFQVAGLYDRVVLTLVSYGESGTTRDVVWHVQGNVSNIVLA